MHYLLIVSIIWAFSFGLIKGTLTNLNPNFVAFVRIFISFLVFLPFIKFKRIKGTKLITPLLAIGGVQFGLMYVSYIYSYQFLMAHEIALFTILTPVYVTIINDLLNRRFDRVSFVSAILAILGAGIIVYSKLGSRDFIVGVILVQIANLCFAGGQICYKRIKVKHPELSNLNVFGILYGGALIVTGIFAGTTFEWSNIVDIQTNQILVLLYLGAIASGLCFFLWNVGATKTKTSTLAVMNNAKIPLAVLASIFIFGESADWTRLLTGGLLMIIAVTVGEKFQS